MSPPPAVVVQPLTFPASGKRTRAFFQKVFGGSLRLRQGLEAADL